MGGLATAERLAEMILTEELAGEERGVIVDTASVAAYKGQIGQAAPMLNGETIRLDGSIRMAPR